MIRILKGLWRLAAPHLLGPERWARRLGVTIGCGCRIYITQWGSEPFLISLGDRVTITSGVKLLTHDGSTWLVRSGGYRYQRYGRISVGSDVFIGVNAVVLPGVTIGSKVVIGAGSIVTHSVPDNSVCVGVPARVVGTFEALECRVRQTCANDEELMGLPYMLKVERALAIQDER